MGVTPKQGSTADQLVGTLDDMLKAAGQPEEMKYCRFGSPTSNAEQEALAFFAFSSKEDCDKYMSTVREKWLELLKPTAALPTHISLNSPATAHVVGPSGATNGNSETNGK